MSNHFNIQSELVRLRASYASVSEGAVFEHFYCPNLFEDSDSELCAGHVINRTIPNTSRRQVVQRKDVDGFYGSLVEKQFAIIVKANKPTLGDIMSDRELRREIKPTISTEDQKVEYYEPSGDVPPAHTEAHFDLGGERGVRLALKMSDSNLGDSLNLQIAVDRDYVPQATASLLKAAHLTMFAVFEYPYVFSVAGQDVAGILKRFYADYKDKPRTEQEMAAQDYFMKYAGMILPLSSFDQSIFQGTVTDKRFILCFGSSGRPYALGVMVRTGSTMHIVFLLTDHPGAVDTYMGFVSDMYKKPFRYRVAKYVDGSGSEPRYFDVNATEYVFDPTLTPGD